MVAGAEGGLKMPSGDGMFGPEGAGMSNFPSSDGMFKPEGRRC